MDLPDSVTTAAVTLAGNVSGTFSIKGVALLTAEEMDAVIGKSVDFRPLDTSVIDCKIGGSPGLMTGPVGEQDELKEASRAGRSRSIRFKLQR